MSELSIVLAAASIVALFVAEMEARRRERVLREQVQLLQREATAWRQDSMVLVNDLVRGLREGHASTLEKVMRMQREGFIAMPGVEAEGGVEVHEGSDEEGPILWDDDWYAQPGRGWNREKNDSA